MKIYPFTSPGNVLEITIFELIRQGCFGYLGESTTHTSFIDNTKDIDTYIHTYKL